MSVKNIYFVHCQITNRVKIGSAFDVRSRLRSLQIGSPTKLTLIGSIGGEQNTEHSLHKLFQNYRSHGEWFEYEGPVRICVEQLLVAAAGVVTQPTVVDASKVSAAVSPLDDFIKQRVCQGDGVPARAMYRSYEDWCNATGRGKVTETAFGRTMKTKLVRDDNRRIHTYVGVALRDHQSNAA